MVIDGRTFKIDEFSDDRWCEIRDSNVCKMEENVFDVNEKLMLPP